MKNISVDFIPYEEFFKEQMKNPEVRKAYEELDFEYEVKNLILKKKIEKKYTYGQLAKKMKVSPTTLSRLIRANFNPSIKVLQKVLKGLDSKLTIKTSRN